MKRALVIGLFIVCAFPRLSTQAEAAEKKGLYFAGKGGPSFAWSNDIKGIGATASRDSTQNAIGAFGMSAGYSWPGDVVPLRTELEFMNRTEVGYNASPAFKNGNSALASSIQNVTLMGKGYYHFNAKRSMWSPFVSGGLGVAHNTMKSRLTPNASGYSKTTASENDLAWSLGVGASFYLGNSVVNDVELRYVSLGSPKWGLPGPDIQAGSLNATELMFALRYNF